MCSLFFSNRAKYRSEQSGDLDFADDAVIIVYATEVLAGALESLSQEAEPLDSKSPGSRPSSMHSVTSLDATIDSIPVSVENAEVTQTFTYLGSVIRLSTSCELEVNRRLG